MKELDYSELVDIYDRLYGTTKRLEKEAILASFLQKLCKKGKTEWVYLLRGRVLPDYDDRELGISTQLVIKAISSTFGIKDEEIYESYKKIGDLGEIAELFAKRKRQSTLFSKKLTVGKVFDNLIKILSMGGKGVVARKIGLVAELLGTASGEEAKYIVRTLIGQLRVGVADAILRDAIAEAFFPEKKSEMAVKIALAYDMSSDFA